MSKTKTWGRRVAATVAAVGGLSMVGSGSAQANHLNWDIYNDTTSTYHARCYTHSGEVYIQGLLPGKDTTANGDGVATSCNRFSVGDNRNVQYRSLSTGNVYWSGCGRTLPHSNPAPAGNYGWEDIGNNVQLLGAVAC